MHKRAGYSLHILLIDDDLMSVRHTCCVLEGLGHHIDCVDSTSGALSHIRSFPYDLVLLDIHLKDADGFKLAHTLKTLPDCKGMIPIMALSHTKNPKDVLQCFTVGLSNFLPKPLEVASFEAAVVPYMARKTKGYAP